MRHPGNGRSVDLGEREAGDGVGDLDAGQLADDARGGRAVGVPAAPRRERREPLAPSLVIDGLFFGDLPTVGPGVAGSDHALTGAHEPAAHRADGGEEGFVALFRRGGAFA